MKDDLQSIGGSVAVSFICHLDVARKDSLIFVQVDVTA